MIALLLSAALTIDQAPAASAPGWAFVSYSGDLNTEALVHTAATPAGSPYPRLWVRYEYEKTTGLAKPAGATRPPRSEVVSVEVDCAQQRSRPLQIIDYEGSNLAGQSFVTTPSDSAWFTATPNTFAEEIDPIACRQSEDPITQIMLSPAHG